MKRTPLQRKTPMTRSKALKSIGHHAPHPLREAARGMCCMVRLPGCLHDPATVVLAHYSLAGYFGKGLKASDQLGAWCCAHCHGIVDGPIPRPDGYTRNDVRLAFAEGVMRTWMERELC